MREELQDISKRAVACPSFRPVRGMIDEGGEVIVSAWESDGGGLPDLTDPATLGCFLSTVLPLCDTEAADLVAAMEAALEPEEK